MGEGTNHQSLKVVFANPRGLGYGRQREIIPTAAEVTGLEVVAVHRHDPPLGRLLNLPEIANAAVFIDNCRDGADGQRSVPGGHS